MVLGLSESKLRYKILLRVRIENEAKICIRFRDDAAKQGKTLFMKIPRRVIREVLEKVEDARDLIDRKLRQDIFLRETSTKQLEDLDDILVYISTLLDIVHEEA